MTSEYKFDTRAVHSGIDPEAWLSATQAPIVQSASHRFGSAEELSAAFLGKAGADIYMRLSNPTNRALEERLRVLEGGVRAVATSSGMAAVADTALAVLRAGSHLVAGWSLFMSTYVLFTQVLPKFGIQVSLVDPNRPEEWQEAVQDNTRLFYLETIGNPAMDVPDVEGLARIAHERGIAVAVDNTLASPWLFRPIERGADIVIHSTTKFLNGHGSAVGGAVIDAGRFGWPEDRYSDFKPFKDRAGSLAFTDRLWREIHINLGTTAAPLHAFLA